MRYGFYPERIIIKEMGPAVLQSGSLLFFVSSGSGTLWINGVRLPLEKGSFGWLHSYHVYRFEPEWEEELELLQCPFDYASASFIAYRSSLKTTRAVMTDCPPAVTLADEEEAYVRKLMEDFIRAGAGQEASGIVEKYSLFLEISTLFLRYTAREQEGNTVFARSTAWIILQHLFTYSNENLTRQKLAAACEVTELEVSRQLRLVTGRGFTQLLNRARIDRACDMMHYGGLTMNFIARYVGYRSETAFCRAFKSVMGTTSQEYQKTVLPRGESVPIDAPALAVFHHILRHFDEPLTVAATANALYLEQNSINRILKENFGMGLSGILTELRLAYARSLLKNSTIPVVDIAFMCGYANAPAFSRLFSSRQGMTPGKYRRFSIYKAAQNNHRLSQKQINREV